MLRSKFYSPKIYRGIIERPRLIGLLEDNADKPVIAVCAPAGYGKSVLISQWLEKRDSRTAWLRLDAGQNNLSAFLSHLVESIRGVSPSSLPSTMAVSRNRRGLSISQIADQLSNEIGSLGFPIHLVLDDYYQVTNPEVHLLLRSILEYPPKQLTFVLVSREVPPLGMSKLRLYDRILELKAEDLSFTPQEVELFFKESNFEVSGTELGVLLRWSEGWILGLKLILSLNSLSPSEHLSLDTNTDHAYLVRQICARLPEGIFQALCLSSLLDGFNAQLLDTLFVEFNFNGLTGEAFIAEMIRLNLFLSPDKKRKGWYRYHLLFRQLVRSQCEDDMEERKNRVLLSASHWFGRHQLVEEAVEYALRARDSALAIQHISTHRQKAFDKDQWWEVDSWIQKLPAVLIRKNASMLLSLMWICEYTWRLGEIPRLLISFENLDLKELSSQNQSEYLLHLGHHYLFYHSNPSKALAYLEDSKALHTDEGMLGARRELCINLALQMVENTERSINNLQNIEKAYPNQSAMYQRSLLTRTFIYLLTADLRLADLICAKLRIVSENGPFPTIDAWSRYLEGNLFFQYGKPGALESFLRTSQFEDALNHRIYFDTLSAIALSHALNGKESETWRAIAELKLKANQTKDHNLRIIAESTEKRIQLILCKPDRSLFTPLSLYETNAMGFFCLVEVPVLTQIRVQVCAGGPKEVQNALKKINSLLKILESANNSFHTLDILILQSLGYFRIGDTGAALEHLNKAFQWYNIVKASRPFKEIQKSNPEFFRWVPLEIMPASLVPKSSGRTNGDLGPSVLNQLPEYSLTPREMEIMKMAAEGLRNQEIAEGLGIKAVTVKSHLTNIFKKLGVKNRTSMARVTKSLGF